MSVAMKSGVVHRSSSVCRVHWAGALSC